MSEPMSPNTLSMRGFLLAAYKSIETNAKAHRITRIVLITYLSTFVIAPPILIMTVFFIFPLQSAQFFNFPVHSNTHVLGASTNISQGNVLSQYISAIFEPQAVATVRLLRVAKPEIGSRIILPDEASEKSITQQPIDDYKIVNIDNGPITYSSYMTKEGSWYIMKVDTDGSIRYVRGDADFIINWENRYNLIYDYFSKVF